MSVPQKKSVGVLWKGDQLQWQQTDSASIYNFTRKSLEHLLKDLLIMSPENSELDA